MMDPSDFKRFIEFNDGELESERKGTIEGYTFELGEKFKISTSVDEVEVEPHLVRVKTCGLEFRTENGIQEWWMSQ